jgi:uncharacterized repeat protein (TIGR01451 family)
LIKAGSVTHSFDMEQRFMELGFRQSGDQLTITAPANARVATPGYYLLFAVDGAGVPSVAATVRVGAGANAGAAPTARATAGPVTGPAPLTVAFDGTASTDPDGDPLTYAWDFGDGQGSTAASPKHTYMASGRYSAVLTVRDDKGWSGRAELQVEVAPGAAPKAAAKARIVLKASGPRQVRRGGTATYRLVVRNRGSAAARKLTVVQRVPRSLRLIKRSRAVGYRRGTVTWRVGDLARGGGRALTLRFRVPAGAGGRVRATVIAVSANAPRVSATRTSRVIG